MSYKLTLRPWIGYDEIAPVDVEVETVDSLMAAARRLVGAGDKEFIKLYYCALNAEGLPINKDTRKHVTTTGDFELARRESSSVVWVCVGGSPATSPQRQKPRSPFIVEDFASVGFSDLPELYEDSAFDSVVNAFLSRPQDGVLAVMMAIPGSGKSRTVFSASERMKLKHIRIKFLDAELKLIRDCIRGAGDYVRDYSEWQDELSVVIKKLLDEKLAGTHEPCVLHVDDAQTLMGNDIVTRAAWTLGSNPWNLVMPTLCSVLHGLLNTNRDLHCVVSGTNFFAPLVLYTGSEAKTSYLPIEGTFPPDWVMRSLVEKYFRIPESLMGAMREHVAFLSGNRRAIQHFLVSLKLVLERKRNDDDLSIAELLDVRRHAFRLWKDPIDSALGGSSSVAVLAVAAIVFPEGFSGVMIKDGSAITFPMNQLPREATQFGLAGGLNLNVSKNSVSVCIPKGCVWEFMCSLTTSALAQPNVAEVEAFVRVAKSVETERGHVFERLVACELSMIGTDARCPFYEWIAKAWKGQGRLVPDPLVFGQPFVYESCIRDMEWLPHQVYCVKEKATDVGKRVVDVGFPVWWIDGRIKKTLRLMCELKKGYATADLWRLCRKYFEDMKECAAMNEDVIVCFVASVSFLQTFPEKRPVQTGVSAHDSRRNCMELIEKNHQFIIVDDVVSHSQFRLAEILDCKAEADVKSLTVGVADIYLGTPSKETRGNEETK